MTSEKDFKSELSATQNLMLCMGLSQKTVLHCTQEFVDNDLKNYISAVPHVLQEVRQVASPTEQKPPLVGSVSASLGMTAWTDYELDILKRIGSPLLPNVW